MPLYHRLGELPPKRHTQLYRPDGKLYTEELFGTAGFSGCSSLLYHHHLPTSVRQISTLGSVQSIPWPRDSYRHHHLRSKNLTARGDVVSGRTPLLFNSDVCLSLARPAAPMDYFYRNGQADELLFVHEGAGTVESIFGLLPFRCGDYIVIPRGTTYRLQLDGGEARFLIIESAGAVETPRRYRNHFGQLLEHSPYCERDIRRPLEPFTRIEDGDFEVRVKVSNVVMSYRYDHHPCDVVGWDGYLYPWILNIGDFEPITGRIHQPPPVHQTFQGAGFVVCSFVPRKLDYHPRSIPIPYNHSNIDCDEVIYYVSGHFGSRKGIEVGSFTLHPRGIPHGPQPGLVEASLGKQETDELAVMVDAFKPLSLAAAAQDIDDPDYPYSWLER